MVLENDVAIQIAEKKLERQRALAAKAEAGLHPTLALEIGGEVGRDDYSRIQDVKIDSDPHAAVGLTVSHTIWNGGRQRSLVDSARSKLRYFEQALNAARNKQLAAAARLVVNVFYTAKTRTMLKEDWEFHRKEVRVETQKLEFQKTTRFKVSKARALKYKSQNRYETEVTRHQNFKEELSFLIGAPVGHLAQLPLRLAQMPKTMADVKQAISKANPDLLAYQFLVDQSAFKVSAAEAEFAPKLQIAGHAKALLTNHQGARTSVGAINLRLSVPLYDGGNKASKLSAARAQSDERQLEFLKLKRSLVRRAIHALRQSNSYEKEIAIQRNRVQSLARTFKAISEEVEFKSKSILDLLDAKRQLTLARYELLETRRKQAISQVRLLSLTGSLFARNDNEENKYIKENIISDYNIDPWIGLRNRNKS